MINLGHFTIPKEAMYSLVVTSDFFPVYPTQVLGTNSLYMYNLIIY